MEKQPITIKKPTLSLMEMALRRIVMIFWNESDILALIAGIPTRSLDLEDCKKIWQETVEDKIRDKLMRLQLPETVSKELIGIVKPIGLEIRRWKMFHERYLDRELDLNTPVLPHLVWTATGTIDFGKTAEKIVRLELLSVENSFRLACLYFLVDYLPVLWDKLSEESREQLIASSFVVANIEVFYWSNILAGRESKLNEICRDLNDIYGQRFRRMFSCTELSFYGFACFISTCRGNRAATEYFYLKLTNEKCETFLIRIACTVVRICPFLVNNFPVGEYVDVLCYLLTMMSPEQQMRFFKERHFLKSFFKSLLEWRYQNVFLHMTDVVWSFLPQSQYEGLRTEIMRRLEDLDYRFSNSFRKFFSSSPSSFRKTFVSCETTCCPFFSKLLKNEDTETIGVVFRNVDAKDRMRLLSFYSFFQQLEDLMLKDKWHLIELCFGEARLSKEDSQRLKERYERFLESFSSMKCEKSQWKRLLELLVKTEAEAFNKRSLEDKPLLTAKKLRCEEEKNVQSKD